MINYSIPTKQKFKRKELIKNSNRGMDLEQLINKSNSFYNENNIYNVSDFKFYNKYINPNNHVLSLLKRMYYKKHGLFIEENNIV